MKATAAFRGQPLLVLAGLLAAWLGVRVVFWQPTVDATLLVAPPLAGAAPHPDPLAIVPGQRPASAASPPLARPPAGYHARGRRLTRPGPARWIAPLPPAFVASPAAEGPAMQTGVVRTALGHTLLVAAGLSQLGLPASLTAYWRGDEPGPGIPAAAPPQAGLPPDPDEPGGSHWSADAWLMVRQDTTAALATGRPSYGRSQAGAVVRYSLAPSDPRVPQAYARLSSALAGPVERDLVAGFSARPLPRVPLRAALEARISHTAQGTEVRPAAIAVTELPPVALGRRLRAEAYLQAGYVGGTFATAFVDGQARLEGTVVRLGRGGGGAEFTAGAGAWGGAQKGAGRLDMGPTAAVSFRLGDTRARIAADYRFRVAGDADPSSGPALTLSAGF